MVYHKGLFIVGNATRRNFSFLGAASATHRVYGARPAGGGSGGSTDGITDLVTRPCAVAAAVMIEGVHAGG